MPVSSHFFAQLSRMRLIYRWPLMRSVQPENISEHSLQVAMVAHAPSSTTALNTQATTE